MSTELNMDAERAAFERIYAELNYSTPGGGWNDFDAETGRYHEEDTHDAWVFWQAARRTAPVSAPIGEELPPLTNDHIIEIADKTRTAESRDGDYILPISFARAIEAEIVAPYAERIRLLERALRSANLLLAETFISTGKAISTRAEEVSDEIERALAGADLERELAERKPATSIRGDNAFAVLMGEWAGAAQSCDEYTRTLGAKHAWNALIAYIDGRTAGATPELYTCIGKGGEYEHIGVAAGAGVTRGNLVHVYRDKASGSLFYRTPMDFDTRMERIAAAPSPLNSGMEGANEN